MSILIKGEAMPKNCGDCPLCAFTADEKRYIGYCNTSDDDYYCKLLDRFMEYDEDGGGVAILGMPDDCPLVEIPEPHGRLIDAATVEESICCHEQDIINSYSDYPYGYNDGISCAAAEVEDAPTVIEAEEQDHEL